MNVTFPCRYCGGPATASIPEPGTEYHDMMMRLAENTVTHDPCYDKWSKEKRAKERHDWELRRAQDWRTVCPPVFQDTDPDKVPSKSGLAAVMAWKWPSPIGIVAHGKTRRGKSRSLMLLASREFDAGRFVIYKTHIQLCYESANAVMNRIRLESWQNILIAADLLIIDDLAKSRFVDSDGYSFRGEETLFHIFESRIERKYPTFFSTEHTGDSLIQRMSADRGPSFVARLREFCVPVAFE